MKEYGYDKPRIDRLRDRVFEYGHDYSEFNYLFYKSLKEKDRGRPYALRVGEAVYDMFDQAAPLILEGELIAGRIANRPFSPEEEREWRLLREYAVQTAPALYGQASHMTIDYELLLNRGAEGLMAEIRDFRAKLDITGREDLEKDNFYASCLRSLEGLIRFAERYALEAERLARNCPDREGREEFLGIVRNLRRVPAKPASGFYEALQAVHFVTFCLSGKPFLAGCHQYQLGRPDRYLWRFYEEDIRTGKISPEEAQTLIDCLAVTINNRVPNGLSSGYMVGGRDKTGKVVSNDLTRMFMKAVEQVNLVYPSVGLCCCAETPEEDIRLAAGIVGKGHSHPAFFNDDVITRGLRYHGMPAEEAGDYIHSTCVEITPVASSNVWVASPYMNLTQKLLDVLDRDYPSMDALLEAYFARIAEGIRENLLNESRWRAERARYALDPLLSCFVNDCLKKGRDIEAGGARYNWIMPSFVGLSNTVDALAAIEKLVFGGGTSFAELRDALSRDFDGYGLLKSRIQNTVPKYGNDNDEADRYAVRLTEWLSKTMEQYQPLHENYLIPSLFCWVMHDRFGRETGASPDGRKAGFPLGDGSGPAQGREGAGPTAAILSSTKWDHHKFIGGIAVNLKFSRKLFNEGSIDKLLALIRTYFERGGFETQINVVDKDTLVRAKAEPEAYRDLVVRIGGYSDYFVKLSPTMQEEVILRTEFQI
jgi:formate C-acetyltransferase